MFNIAICCIDLKGQSLIYANRLKTLILSGTLTDLISSIWKYVILILY